jgi:hypothetical protein
MMMITSPKASRAQAGGTSPTIMIIPPSTPRPLVDEEAWFVT